MIPYFLSHYSGWVNQFHIFDNGSTDSSLRLLAGDPRIKVEPFETEGDSFVETAQRLMNNVWRRSKEADWVIAVEMDEHLHHPDILAYLEHCAAERVTVISPVGFNMYSETFPTDPRPLSKQIVRGLRDPIYDKKAIFDPRAIVSMNYEVGRHVANPTGNVVLEKNRQVTLLHYKNLGVDYVEGRNELLSKGLRGKDRSERWGEHYFRTRADVEGDLRHIATRSRRVPGLFSEDCPIEEPTFDEELAIIERSGLFDSAYYLATNRDVRADTSLSPLQHFCIYGSSEGRRPNALFDPVWYTDTYALDPRPANPLVHYILSGEALQHRPSASFDPGMYRYMHRLLRSDPVLLHALRERQGPA
jgi:hypothetical protein